jgi:acyl carrier protein
MKITEPELIQIIATALECDPTSLNATSALGHHYNWDSFGQLSIMVELEDKYKIEINEDNISKLITFKNILNYLNQIDEKSDVVA